MLINRAFRSVMLSIALLISSAMLLFESVLESIKALVEPTFEHVIERITATGHALKVTTCREQPRDAARCDTDARNHVSMLKSLGGELRFA